MMAFLIGITPRSRRAYTRRVRAQREKRMENITRNVTEYAFYKQEQARDQASNARMDRSAAEARRHEEMTNRRIQEAMNQPLGGLVDADVAEDAITDLLAGDDE